MSFHTIPQIKHHAFDHNSDIQLIMHRIDENKADPETEAQDKLDDVIS
jgi:hypothetical protein